jgi:spore maturation protein CgeB
VFDQSYQDILQETGARAVSFLPCAADHKLYKPQRLTRSDCERYGTNISLIGVYSKRRGEVVSALCNEHGFGIWGPGWKAFLAQPTINAACKFRGEYLAPDETCKVYNASPINLNTHHPQSQLAGLNTRSFEILAAGAFELVDYIPGMESLLDPGRDIAVYHCPEEAVEISRYYLKAHAARRRIAESGYQRVLAAHTYRHRMQTVLSTLSL